MSVRKKCPGVCVCVCVYVHNLSVDHLGGGHTYPTPGRAYLEAGSYDRRVCVCVCVRSSGSSKHFLALLVCD